MNNDKEEQEKKEFIEDCQNCFKLMVMGGMITAFYICLRYFLIEIAVAYF